jgi:hypothetical protein
MQFQAFLKTVCSGYLHTSVFIFSLFLFAYFSVNWNLTRIVGLQIILLWCTKIRVLVTSKNNYRIRPVLSQLSIKKQGIIIIIIIIDLIYYIVPS